MTKERATTLIAQYKAYPWMFTDEQVDELHKISTDYEIPFEKKTLATADDTLLENIGRTAAQIPAGFVEGFTTIKMPVVEPNDPIEKIARNVGHLAGFIGVIPGIGTAASGATKAGIRATTILGRKAITGASVPMLAAYQAEKLLSKAAGKLITAKAAQTIEKHGMAKLGTVLAKSAFHLGTASAVSTWTEGIDSMMESFVGGSIAGAGFGLLGFIPDIGEGPTKAMARIVGMSLFTGLPSTLRNDTTPEQVYEYLLGAWFGRHGRPHNAQYTEYLDARYKQAIGKSVETVLENGGFSDEAAFEMSKIYSDFMAHQKEGTVLRVVSKTGKPIDYQAYRPEIVKDKEQGDLLFARGLIPGKFIKPKEGEELGKFRAYGEPITDPVTIESIMKQAIPYGSTAIRFGDIKTEKVSATIPKETTVEIDGKEGVVKKFTGAEWVEGEGDKSGHIRKFYEIEMKDGSIQERWLTPHTIRATKEFPTQEELFPEEIRPVIEADKVNLPKLEPGIDTSIEHVERDLPMGRLTIIDKLGELDPENQNTVLKLIHSKFIDKSTNTWHDRKSAVRDALNALGDNLKGLEHNEKKHIITNLYNNNRYTRESNQYVYDVNENKLIKLTDGIDPNAPERTKQSFFDDRLYHTKKNSWHMVFKKGRRNNGNEGSLSRVFKSAEEASLAMQKSGKYIFYGRGDDGSNLRGHQDWRPDLKTESQIKEHLQKELPAEIYKDLVENQLPYTKEVIENYRQEAIEQNKAKKAKNPKAKVSDPIGFNELHWWKNAANMHEMLKWENGDKYFELNPKELNVLDKTKRHVIDDAQGIPLQANDFSKPKKTVKFEIHEKFNYDGYDKTAWDGRLLTHPEILKATANALGTEFTGHAKAFITVKHPEHGIMKFKMLMTGPATKEELAFLEKKGVGLYGDSSVLKVMGGYKFGTVDKLNVGGIRVQQMMGNDIEAGRTPQLAQYLQLMYQQDNKQFWDVIFKSGERVRKELDDILALKDDPIKFGKALDKFIAKASNMPTVDEAEQFINETSMVGPSAEIIKKAGLDRHIALMTPTRPYIANTIRQYIVSRISRPETPGFHVILSGKPESIVKTFPEMKGNDHNNVVLGHHNNPEFTKKVWKQILENSSVAIPEHKKEYGALLTRIEKQGNKLYSLKDYFDLSKSMYGKNIPIAALWARAPIDNKGGISVVKVIGMSDLGYNSAFTSEKLMNKSGGADSDGDKAGMWFAMPKEYMRNIHKDWDYLSKEIADIDQKIADKLKASLPDVYNGKANFLNPHLSMEAAYGSSLSKDKVGSIATLKRALYVMARRPEFDSWWNTIKDKLTLKDKEYLIDIETAEAYRITLDSGKYGGIKNWSEFEKGILDKIFKNGDQYLEARNNAGFVKDLNDLVRAVYSGRREFGGKKVLYEEIYELAQEYKNNYGEIIKDSPVDISKSKRKGTYFKKDLDKFKKATKLIAFGEPNTSSRAYAETVDQNQLNVGNYKPGDIAGYTVNGGNKAIVDSRRVIKELNNAIKVKADIVGDTKPDRDRHYNLGERIIAKHLEQSGYKEISSGIWRHPDKPEIVGKLTNIEKVLTSLPEYYWNPMVAYNPSKVNKLLVGRDKLNLRGITSEGFKPMSIGAPYANILEKHGIRLIKDIETKTPEQLKEIWESEFKYKDHNNRTIKTSLKSFITDRLNMSRLGKIIEPYLKKGEKLATTKAGMVTDFEKIYKNKKYIHGLTRSVLAKANDFVANDLYLINSSMILGDQRYSELYTRFPDGVKTIKEKVEKLKKDSAKGENVDSLVKDFLNNIPYEKVNPLMREYAEMQLLSSLYDKVWYGKHIDGDRIIKNVIGSPYISKTSVRRFFDGYRQIADYVSRGVVTQQKQEPELEIPNKETSKEEIFTVFTQNSGVIIPQAKEISNAEISILYNNLKNHPVLARYFESWMEELYPFKFGPGKAGIYSLTENEIRGINRRIERLDKGTLFQRVWSKISGQHPMELNGWKKEMFANIGGSRAYGLIREPKVFKIAGNEFVSISNPIEQIFENADVMNARTSAELEQEMIPVTIDGKRQLVSANNALDWLNKIGIDGKPLTSKQKNELFALAVLQRESNRKDQKYKDKYNPEVYEKLSKKEKEVVDKLRITLDELFEFGNRYIHGTLDKDFYKDIKNIDIDTIERNIFQGGLDGQVHAIKKYQMAIIENELRNKDTETKVRIREKNKHLYRIFENEQAIKNYLNLNPKDNKKLKADINLVKAVYSNKNNLIKHNGKTILLMHTPTGIQDFYFVHRWRSTKEFMENARIAIKEEIENMRAQGIDEAEIKQWSKEVEQKLINAHMTREHGLLVSERKDEMFPDFGVMRVVGNLKARTLDIQGYKLTRDTILDYFSSLFKMRHSNNFALQSDKILRDYDSKEFRLPGADKELTGKIKEQWREWLVNYVRDNLGFTIEDRKFLGFLQVGDKKLIDRLNSIRTKVFKGAIDKEPWTPLNAKRIAELEGKYELASLLFHMKTGTTNVLFGTSNIVIMAGAKNMWNGFRLYRTINKKDDGTVRRISPYKELQTPKDVEKIINESGVILEFLRNEVGIKAEQGNLRSFFKYAADLRKEQNGISFKKLKELAHDYDVEDTITRYGGIFMQKSEKLLRFSSVLTGYLHARKELGMNHRHAIQFGRKFVETTQFMYDVAWRPQGTRSSFGKILSRFRLWAWNSVSFRREIFRNAKEAGMELTNPEVQRFIRMSTIDLFAIALANALAYTLFDYGLPPPYAQIKDAAELAFGDENDKKRAFYGTYGLTEFTPPIFRIGMFKSLLNLDFNELSKYQLWTLFPFGRMGRDVYRSWENPGMVTDFLTGIPTKSLHRYVKRSRDEATLPKPF